MTTGPISLLVADPNVRGRLAVVDALRGACAVHIPGPGESPLRALRRIHPAVVLLAVPRGRANEAVRTCRIMKTDSSKPPRVGLLDPRSRLLFPERSVSAALADGYIGGALHTQSLLDFVQALHNGDRPMIQPPPSRTTLRRLIDRVRRRNQGDL
ncbi:MAG: hypothetical protein AAFV53_40185 [Myxococcota bacterium]